MCGIFAAPFGWTVQRNIDAMRYRGPDDERYETIGNFCIGFARLALTDITSPDAVQPYVNAKGSRVTVLNGELYNYRCLDPDATSEVRLVSEMLDGRADPRRFLDGDYAILSYEPSLRRVTLFRDRFGACPLYYQVKPWVAVSSERRRLSGKVREVLPYERVVIEFPKKTYLPGRVVQRDQLKHYGLTLNPADQMAAEDLLLSAVKSRIDHSPGDYSMTCSGGLDSSAVILASRLARLRKPKALLCVTMGDTEDAKFAHEIARRVPGVPLYEIEVTSDMLLEDQKAILQHSDFRSAAAMQPVQWRVAVRNWYVAKHSPTRIVITGEGSDELFDGYPPHPERLKVPWRIANQQLKALRSLPKCSLELSNKIGLAHSVEFRAPFLHSQLSYALLSMQTGARKQVLRDILRKFGAPDALVNRSKWGSNEERLDASHAAS